MNERIRQLYYECQDESQSTEQCYQNFAELIVRECADRCGSQADQRNLLTSFGFEVQSNVKYPAPERHWSIKSQYDREYNLPKGVTNEPKN